MGDTKQTIDIEVSPIFLGSTWYKVELLHKYLRYILILQYYQLDTTPLLNLYLSIATSSILGIPACQLIFPVIYQVFF